MSFISLHDILIEAFLYNRARINSVCEINIGLRQSLANG